MLQLAEMLATRFHSHDLEGVPGMLNEDIGIECPTTVNQPWSFSNIRTVTGIRLLLQNSKLNNSYVVKNRS